MVKNVRKVRGKTMTDELTLENIFSNATDEELRAIVSSIIARLNHTRNLIFLDNHNGDYGYEKNQTIIHLSDYDLKKFVKTLRNPA